MSKKKIKFPSDLVDSIEVQKVTLGENYEPANNNDVATKKYVDDLTVNASQKALSRITIVGNEAFVADSAESTVNLGYGTGIKISSYTDSTTNQQSILFNTTYGFKLTGSEEQGYTLEITVPGTTTTAEE